MRAVQSAFCTIVMSMIAVSAVAADATGVWKGDVKLPNGQVLPFIARLQQHDSAITGKLDGINGAPDVDVVDGKFANDVVTFSGVREFNNAAVKFNYTAKFRDADTLEFTIVREDGAQPPLSTVARRTRE